jgi:hypothetical protein
MDETVRQRSLASMDVLLNATRQQLELLMRRDQAPEGHQDNADQI